MKLYKKLIPIALATCSIMALSLTAATCRPGSSSTDTNSTRTFSYNLQLDPYSTTKTSDKVTIWLPWTQSKTSYAADAAIIWLKKIFTNAEIITPKENKDVDYKNASKLLNQYILADNATLIPDVIINYQDVAAVLEKYSLLQGFGDVDDVVSPSLISDSRQVLSYTGSNYLLPFAKSTQLMYFDVILFGKILSDIAAVKSFNTNITVPANSAQQRMIKMILNPSNVYTNIYSEDNTNTVFDLRNVVNAYNTKTAFGGIWEKDAIKINENYKLRNQSKDYLLQIDFSKEIFTAFDEIKQLLFILSQAYQPTKKSNKSDSSYFFAMESPSNQIYSYQYDKAGHSLDNFFINKYVEKGVPSLNFDLTSGKNAAALDDGYTWIKDVVNTNEAVIKTSKISSYGTDFVKEHRSLFSIASSSNENYVVDVTGNEPQFANLGEVYYDLQPTKSSLSEKKHSIINQGPSIFVTKIQGAEKAAEIVNKLKTAYKTGAVIEDGEDKGYWGRVSYMYGNSETYKNSDYINYLSLKAANSTNWQFLISKYLVANFYINASLYPDKYDIFANPTGPTTAYVRDSIGNYVLKAYDDFPNADFPVFSKLLSELIKQGTSDKIFKEN